MAKRIEETSYHIGSGQNAIETNSFIYQKTTYKYSKRLVELVDTKLFSSDKYIKFKKTSKYVKDKDCFYLILIDIIGVPKSFIEHFDLEENPKPKKKK